MGGFLLNYKSGNFLYSTFEVEKIFQFHTEVPKTFLADNREKRKICERKVKMRRKVKVKNFFAINKEKVTEFKKNAFLENGKRQAFICNLDKA